MSSDCILEVKNINSKRKRFSSGKPLQNISFSLPAGYIMGLIGKNGSGKTSFFNLMADEAKRYDGSILLDDMDIHENHTQALEQIGFISEENIFLESRSIGQNAQLLGKFFTDFDMESFNRTLEAESLSASKTVHNLSRGERMKFRLAFAIAHRPKLYLIDEATAGMDAIFRQEFYRLLRERLEEDRCSVILSTHLEEEIKNGTIPSPKL